MSYIVDVSPSEQDIAEIHTALIEFNRPHLEGISHDPLACYYLVDDVKKAGVIADVRGHWLLLKFFWVAEEQRGKGIGAQLLAKLERQAKEMGCRMALVDTLSFQAKPFYEKQGYECQMVLENYPIDTSLYYLTKSLS